MQRETKPLGFNVSVPGPVTVGTLQMLRYLRLRVVKLQNDMYASCEAGWRLGVLVDV